MRDIAIWTGAKCELKCLPRIYRFGSYPWSVDSYFFRNCTVTDQENITNRSITAVLWGVFGSVARIASQILAQIVLARLLGPEQYGLFAISVIVINFSSFFSDVGIAYGLIQKKKVSDADIRFVFTWQLVLGAIVAASVFLLANPLSSFFNEPRVVPIIKFLALVCFINALSAPSLNLLKRDLNFKVIQLSQVISYVCGYIVVAIPLAIAGCEIWSLVAAWLVQSSIHLSILYYNVKHPLKPMLWHSAASGLLKYGITVFATNLVNWVTNSVDRVVVGKMFSTASVGLYSTSYNLMNTPTVTVMGVLQSTLFSGSAKVQGDKTRVRKAFYTVVGSLSIFTMPVFVGIATVSNTMILALYGQEWIEAAVLLRPIALAMPLYLLIGMATPMLWVVGKITKELKIQVPFAFLWLGGTYAAALYTPEAVAWSVLGLFVLRSTITVGAANKALGIGAVDFFARLKGGLLISVAILVALLAADLMGRQLFSTPIVWLLIDISVGAVVLVLSLFFFPCWVPAEVAVLMANISSRLPSVLSSFVGRLFTFNVSSSVDNEID